MLHKKKRIDITYFDCEKVFDLLTHEKLLYLITESEWQGDIYTSFPNFLTERFFDLDADSVRSAYYTMVHSGVPQDTNVWSHFIQFVKYQCVCRIDLFANPIVYGWLQNQQLSKHHLSLHFIKCDTSKLHHCFTSWYLKIVFEKFLTLHLDRNSFEF